MEEIKPTSKGAERGVATVAQAQQVSDKMYKQPVRKASKGTWANVFKENRRQMSGIGLMEMQIEKDEVQVLPSDLDKVEKA